MTKTIVHGVTIECTTGDIARQDDIAAVVNAANAELRTGGGVAGALHRAAGPGLEAECRLLAPIRPGQAVVTSGHNLPNTFVIHCLGPVYGRDEPSSEHLASCYRNALRLADEHGAASVGFPSISTGAFGFPMRDAASIAFRTVRDAAPGLSNAKCVRFILAGEDALRLHEEVMAEVFGIPD